MPLDLEDIRGRYTDADGCVAAELCAARTTDLVAAIRPMQHATAEVGAEPAPDSPFGG